MSIPCDLHFKFPLLCNFMQKVSLDMESTSKKCNNISKSDAFFRLTVQEPF